MSINIGNLKEALKDVSAAKRKEMAETILAMSPDAQREFLEQLTITSEVDARFDAQENQKKAAIARIAAAKSGTLGERNAIGILEGTLKRAGIELDEIVNEPNKIDKLFAAAGPKLSTENCLMAKSMLYRLGVIAQ